MAEHTEKDCIQVVTYIRRKRTLTPKQFYNHWENVHAPKVIPWAEKHGIRRYQQVHVSGKMVPSAATDSAPNAISKSELPIEPIEFDGIAMFLVPSLEKFTEAFKDLYYLEVIEPDEQELIDKDGPGSGVVASYQGQMIDMVHMGKSAVGDKGQEYRDAFKEFEKRKA